MKPAAPNQSGRIGQRPIGVAVFVVIPAHDQDDPLRSRQAAFSIQVSPDVVDDPVVAAGPQPQPGAGQIAVGAGPERAQTPDVEVPGGHAGSVLFDVAGVQRPGRVIDESKPVQRLAAEAQFVDLGEIQLIVVRVVAGKHPVKGQRNGRLAPGQPKLRIRPRPAPDPIVVRLEKRVGGRPDLFVVAESRQCMRGAP